MWALSLKPGQEGNTAVEHHLHAAIDKCCRQPKDHKAWVLTSQTQKMASSSFRGHRRGNGGATASKQDSNCGQVNPNRNELLWHEQLTSTTASSSRSGYGGVLIAYDIKTGKVLWNYTAAQEGFESPYGNYPNWHCLHC